jgi:hypothetical protein
MAGSVRSRALRLAVPLLTVVLLVGACGSATPSPASSGGPSPNPAVGPIADRTLPDGATAQVDDATWALADRLSASDYTSDTTAAMQAALARSGIATVPDGSTDPAAAAPEAPLTAAASPLELLDFQTHALAVGAWAGATWSGAELDDVVPLPDGTPGIPSTSALLAAYVASADSPGGALSRALMAGQDLLAPATLHFPAVVLMLFVSDLATDGGRLPAPSPSPGTSALDTTELLALAQTGSTVARHVAPAISIDTICSDTATWINNTIDRLFNALKLAVPDNVPGAVVVTAVNFLISAGAFVSKGLIGALTAPVLATVRSIAALIAGVAEHIATVLPYAVKVAATGGAGGGATFVLGSNLQIGSFDAHVTAGDLPTWPAVLSDCAKTAEIDLPDFRVKAAPVTFGPLHAPADPLISPTAQAATNTVTDANGSASWSFEVAHDPGDSAGEQLNQVDTMPVAVHRPELDAARAKLTDTLLAPIPGVIRPFVAALFAPILDGLQSRLNLLLDARGSGRAQLVYHAPLQPTPTPSPTSVPSFACGLSVMPGVYNGTYAFTSDTNEPPASAHTTGTGPATLTVAADGAISGSLSYHAQRIYDATVGQTHDHQESAFSMTGVVLGGSICDLTQTGGSLTVESCLDSVFGDCAGTAPTGGLPETFHDGPPTAVTSGHLTWSASHVDAAAGTSDTWSLALSGP